MPDDPMDDTGMPTPDAPRPSFMAFAPSDPAPQALPLPGQSTDDTERAMSESF